MPKKEKRRESVQNDKTDAAVLYEFAVDLAEKKYTEEKEREESLIAQASQMQTVFSIVTGVLFVLLPICIEHRRNIPMKFFFISVAIVSVTLLASLILSSVVHWRYKTKVMPDVSTIEQIVLEGNDWQDILKPEGRGKMYFDYLKEAQESKCKVNDQRVKLIIASIICFWCSIGEALISAIIAVLLY